jgi:eukaryotic-like serine/threonine-protein kinase
MDTTLPVRLQRALGDRYAVERELAPGGMSRLFLAIEPALERKVVVKLLPPEMASEATAERFRREMLLMARLQHPHILPVLDANSRDGLLYYVMPFVDGESLRARLAREGQLAVTDTVRILREIADALVCAHGVGVVHRDVKPENVLFQHDHAVLADFGVARGLALAGLGDRLTGTGLGLGTVGYMAPEQLGGEPEVDARADLYALGVIAYEMLAGVAPFAAESSRRLVALHLTERPRPLAELRAEVPPALAALVSRLLEKEPGARPASAADVLRDLNEIATPRVTPKSGPSLVRSGTGGGHGRTDPHELFLSTILAKVRFTDEQIAWIKSAFVPRSFRKGQVFQRPGDVAIRGGFVTRGLFRTYAVSASGTESIIRFSPEIVGWIGDLHAATSGTPASYFVDAIEPSEALVFDMPSFERLLGMDPEQGRDFRIGLQKSREAMERRIAMSLHSSAEERYADFVARQPALAVRVPQRMLASYLGMTPETLSRVRRKTGELGGES